MFSKRLKQVMEDRNINQKELSERSGVSRAGISQYLSGKFEPNKKTLKLIADALEVPESYFNNEFVIPQVEVKDTTLTVDQCASLMGKSKQFVRVGLQNGVFPFGYALKMSGKFSYFISRLKFIEYTGIQIKEG